MKLKASKFKTKDGQAWLEEWHQEVIKSCNLNYTATFVPTKYGKTHVWCKNEDEKDKPALLFLPGFRTCGIYWDMNNTLAPFYQDYRIYLVDVIGQPGLSDLTAPSLKGDDFGHWLVEVLDGLGLDKVVVAGASYGGQLMVKLASVAPERVELMVGFNPVGVQFVSLGPRAMWYNALHMLFPTAKNVNLYLEKMVLDPRFEMQKNSKDLLLAYQQYVVKHFKFGCDYPYKFSDKELTGIKTPAYYILCDNDNLIQQRKTAERAAALLPNFKRATFFKEIGHGIEVAPAAYVEFAKILEEHFGKKA